MTSTPTGTGKAGSRLAAIGLAAAVAAALTACGGGGSSTTNAGTTGGGSVSGKTSATQPAATPSAPESFDPAQGPTQDPATLPKNCNGLVTDADIQLQLGGPLASGDVFTAYLPVDGIKQTKKVKCQYGAVVDAAGKFQSDQLEVQLATYADVTSAKSRAASTVGTLAGGTGAVIKQETVGGHPATLVTSSTDDTLVMYDGNRTFLVTIEAALAQGDKSEKLALGLMQSLYKHTLPAGGAAPSASATPGADGTPGAPTSDAATPGAGTSSAPPAATPTT